MPVRFSLACTGSSKVRSGSRFILFAEPRTGSASLLKCLQAHSALRVLDGPFNENWVSWDPSHADYRAMVRDRATLEATVEDLFEACEGFKVSGYQLQGDEVGGLPRSIDEFETEWRV